MTLTPFHLEKRGMQLELPECKVRTHASGDRKKLLIELNVHVEVRRVLSITTLTLYHRSPPLRDLFAALCQPAADTERLLLNSDVTL